MFISSIQAAAGRRNTSRISAVAAACVALATLSACSTTQVQADAQAAFTQAQTRARAITVDSPTIGEQAGVDVRGGNKHLDAQAAAQRQMPVARRASSPFIGGGFAPMTSEDRLPGIFYEQYTLDFADLARGGRVPLSVAMTRLSKLTGVAVRIQPDVYAAGRQGQAAPSNAPQRMTPPAGAGGSPMPSPMLTNGQPAQGGPAVPMGGQQQPSDALSQAEPLTLEGVEMKWSGTLADYLKLVTDQLGLAWEWRENSVVVMRLVAEAHEIYTSPSATKFSLSSSGRGSGSGGEGGATNAAAASMDVSESGSADPVEAIVKAVNSIVADVPGAKVTRVDGTGRLMVISTRETQSRVREFIAQENKGMRQQVAVQFDVYSVITNSSREAGLNWQLLLAKAGEAGRITMTSPTSLVGATTGGVSAVVLPGVKDNPLSEILANSSAVLQALNQQGVSAQHRPVTLLAPNRKWSRISKMATDYYVSETTPGPASSTGVGAPGIKTASVTTGDQYIAMPMVMADNSMLLKFGLSLSDLLGLFDQTVGQGATQQKVQAPKLSAVNAQFEVMVRPGEVIAVTGLSRRVASDDKRRLFEGAPVGAGGSDKTKVDVEHFIIFVRPTLL